MAEWFQLERDSVMLSGICGSPDRSVELCAGTQVQLCTVGGGLCLHWNAKAAHTATSLQWGHCHGQVLSQLQLRKEDCGSEVR